MVLQMAVPGLDERDVECLGESGIVLNFRSFSRLRGARKIA
ncbi:MAG: hypothetical protein JWN70_204 [Planctomycetaceae bacterium]|nr:hypothetical protein [Planctomycetaceae bacterium]